MNECLKKINDENINLEIFENDIIYNLEKINNTFEEKK